MSTPVPGGAADRAARALRVTLLVTAGACLGLGAMGLALALLTGTDSSALWPGLTLLALGQLVALVAAAVAGTGLRRVLAGAPPREVTTRVRARLGHLSTALVALLAVAAAGWILARPSAVVAVLACALVSVQLAVVLRLLRR
ncbi:hypothetical protein [Georgenia subflava]|uniref:hypothetical protein n=1 Tax=Georgenia subflava TaxID=1622177 RepID=UPI00186B27EA|nr:hypothetical protein [Georgenia subflava]